MGQAYCTTKAERVSAESQPRRLSEHNHHQHPRSKKCCSFRFDEVDFINRISFLLPIQFVFFFGGIGVGSLENIILIVVAVRNLNLKALSLRPQIFAVRNTHFSTATEPSSKQPNPLVFLKHTHTHTHM